jgi:S1-C subfamily serine protease
VTRLIIQHIEGSKANQIEQFDAERYEEILIGRDTDATISFDPDRDDLVSRDHAVILIKKGDPPTFVIADRDSRNGTYVNGQRLAGDRQLESGDTIELGQGGPRFSIDIEPRPRRPVAETRIGPLQKATRITAALEDPPESPEKAVAHPNDVVGRETVMRMMSEQQNSTTRTVTLALAGIVVLGALMTGVLYHFGMVFGMSAKEIASRYGAATVVVEAQWRIFDKSSGRPVYQHTCTFNERPLLCFVQLPDGTILRWLTLDDNDHRNVPLRGGGRGSGFVVADQGFVLTNKHVAAGWMVPDALSSNAAGGYVVQVAAATNDAWRVVRVAPFTPNNYASIKLWEPEQGAVLVGPNPADPDTLVLLRSGPLEGRNESLSVRFPDTRDSVRAELVRASPEADVAEIKIESVQRLPTISLGTGERPSVGERVTVLGYPGLSEERYATVTTNEAGVTKQHDELVPEPTVTEGIIAKVGAADQNKQNVTTRDTLGDVYQLTVTATGHGNSGGPVFDAKGKVIGLFTYAVMDRSSGERITFAVPIQYGLDLLGFH